MSAVASSEPSCPPDYQEFVYETFNIPANRKFQNYSMQELNSGMPRCQKGGRYHVPPWMVPFVLNKDGDALLPHGEGEIEGRAAFFDLALDGRWGGVITGDKISLDFDPCACGAQGPVASATTSSATPTSKATTRSAAPGPSTPT